MDNEEYNLNQPDDSGQEACADQTESENSRTDHSNGPYDNGSDKNNGPYNNGPYNQYGRSGYDNSRPGKGTAMATAALVFGILSIVCFYIAPLAVVLGALALIFAVLSRGTNSMSGRAKAAAVLASLGMIVSCASTGYLFYRVYHDSDLRYQLEQALDYYSRYYGLDLNDTFHDLFNHGYSDDNNGRLEGGHSYTGDDGNSYYYYYYYNNGNGAAGGDDLYGNGYTSGDDIAASLRGLTSDSDTSGTSASWKGGAFV